MCMCLVGTPDLPACMLYGSAAESSSSMSLPLLSALSFQVMSLHHQLSSPKTSCWCRTDRNPGAGTFCPIAKPRWVRSWGHCFPHAYSESSYAALLFSGESENIFEDTHGDKLATVMMHMQRP